MDSHELRNLFRYHPPLPGQAQKYERLRAAALAFAEVVVAETPPSADQSAALRKIRESVMTANAAIACHRTGPPHAAPIVRNGAELDSRPAP